LLRSDSKNQPVRLLRPCKDEPRRSLRSWSKWYRPWPMIQSGPPKLYYFLII